MLIADHINLMFKNPLVGPVAEGDERFPRHERSLRPGAPPARRDVARTERIALKKACTPACSGRRFETPAEIRMLQRLGADAWDVHGAGGDRGTARGVAVSGSRHHQRGSRVRRRSCRISSTRGGEADLGPARATHQGVLRRL